MLNGLLSLPALVGEWSGGGASDIDGLSREAEISGSECDLIENAKRPNGTFSFLIISMAHDARNANNP